MLRAEESDGRAYRRCYGKVKSLRRHQTIMACLRTRAARAAESSHAIFTVDGCFAFELFYW